MRKSLLALLATTAIVFAACGGAASQAPTATTAPVVTAAPTAEPVEIVDLTNSTYDSRVEAGVDGGQIIIGDWQEANQFNPYYSSQVTEANVLSATTSSMGGVTDDFRYSSGLATEIPTTTNGGVKVPGDGGDAMTVTWTLRDGLKWSDGEALTCDDFKYAWEWVLDPENVGVLTAGFDVITAVDCPSDTTIVAHFKEIFSSYFTLFLAPLPRHHLEAIPMTDQIQGAGFRSDEISKMPVSGPFKYESVTPGAEVRLVRNDQYVNPRTGKPAHLDTLIFKWYGDADAMIAGFAAGEVDVATDLQDSDIPKLEAQGLNANISAIPALLYEFLRPNWSAGPMDTATGTGGCSRNPVVQDRGTGCPVSDAAFRAALPFAIDKNAINARLLGDTVQVANTNISPSAWFFADQTPATFDPEQAKQILEAGGWVDGDGDGVREKDGLRAKIELCTTTRQVRVDTLALLADWLKDVGIEAIPNPVSAADIFAGYNESTIDTPCALSRSNFDIAEHAFSSSIDPYQGYYTYDSSQFEPTGSNDAQVVDPAIDATWATVRGTVDFVAIKKALADFQQVYVEKTVEVPLYYRKQVDLVSPRLGNFFANGTQAGPTWNADDWYVKG